MRTCFLLIISCFILVGCSPHYQIIQLESFIDPDTGQETHAYATVVNGMLIPEYSVDRTGAYPETREEAEKRLLERKEKLEPIIQSKYKIPNSTLHQATHVSASGAKILLYPITKPLSMGKPATTDTPEGKVDSMPSTLIPKKPIIHDEFKAI